MRSYILLVFSLIFFFSSAAISVAASYYVSPNGNDTFDGRSDKNAWKTISRVNSNNFNEGDDVYFKCGGVWNLPVGSNLLIDWGGTFSNHVTIGAYYTTADKTVHGLSGKKPIFNGNNKAPLEYNGLVEISNKSYVDLENIRVINSAGHGIYVVNSDNCSIRHCEVDYAYRGGIMINLSNTVVGEYNDITRWGNRFLTQGSWTGGLVGKDTMYATFRHNVVHEGWGEGINFGSHSGKGGGHLAEYNVVYDARAAGIYFWNVGDPDAHNVCRYNLVYGTGNPTYSRVNYNGVHYSGQGIYVVDEYLWGHHQNGYIECYGNLVAGFLRAGLWIGFSQKSGGICTDSVFYNNTFVDTRIGIYVTADRFSNSKVMNNIFWKISGDHKIVDGANPTSAEVNYNLWSDQPGLSAYRGTTDPPYSAPLLLKTSNWQSLKPGTLKGIEFSLQAESTAIGAGKTLEARFSSIADCNQSDWTTMGRIVLEDQRNKSSGWDIGADIHIENSVPGSTTLLPPENLRAIVLP